jgi:hypothetical protein
MGLVTHFVTRWSGQTLFIHLGGGRHPAEQGGASPAFDWLCCPATADFAAPNASERSTCIHPLPLIGHFGVHSVANEVLAIPDLHRYISGIPLLHFSTMGIAKREDK